MADVPRLTDVVKLGQQSRLGLGMARAVTALVQCNGDLLSASQIALGRWPSQPEIYALLKTAVSIGSLGNGTWGGSTIAPTSTLISEFVSATQAASVLGRLANLHRIPFNVRIPRELTGATVSWTAESAAKPVTELGYDALVALAPSKVDAIVIVSDELSRSSSPNAEQVIRNSLVSSIASFVDRAFLDPASAATASHPGSLPSQVTAITPSGSTAASLAADIVSLVDALVAGGNSELASLVLIMSPRMATRVAAKRDTSGGSAFGSVTVAGGTLLGIPVVTSTSAPLSASGGGGIVLLDANEILLADDGEVSISLSSEAAVQMSSTPSNSASTLISLWQSNLLGIRAERAINWSTRHGAAAACAFLDGLAL